MRNEMGKDDENEKQFKLGSFNPFLMYKGTLGAQ